MCLGYILSVSTVEEMGGKIPEAMPGETRPKETVRSEDGTVNHTSIVGPLNIRSPGDGSVEYVVGRVTLPRVLCQGAVSTSHNLSIPNHELQTQPGHEWRSKEDGNRA